jgi:DNA-directed RNA polymerase subunit RPC12/RpoP
MRFVDVFHIDGWWSIIEHHVVHEHERPLLHLIGHWCQHRTSNHHQRNEATMSAFRKPYRCVMCGKRYMHKKRLRTHQRLTGHNHQSYVCMSCGIKAERTNHNLDKPTVCRKCGLHEFIVHTSIIEPMTTITKLAKEKTP